jgi:hypothetical protein
MGNLGMELNNEITKQMEQMENVNQDTIQDNIQEQSSQDSIQLELTPNLSFEQFKLLSQDKSQFTKENLGIKSYLSHVQRKLMIDDICDMTLQVDDNGMAYIDYCMLEFAKVIYFFKYYIPCVELNQDAILEQYDWIVENGIMKTIYNFMDNDAIWTLEEIINQTLESQVKRHNSVEAILAKNMNRLQDHADLIMDKINGIDQGWIEKIIGKLCKSIKGFNPEKFTALQDMLKLSKGEN